MYAIRVHVCVCVCMYVCMYIYVCMCVLTYVYKYVCMYVCIHTYIHRYIHTYSIHIHYDINCHFCGSAERDRTSPFSSKSNIMDIVFKIQNLSLLHDYS